MDSNYYVEIPKAVENMQLPDPGLLQYYQDLENRIVWLDTEVCVDCLYLIRYILKWNQEDKDLPIESRQPIRLLFFSPGGDLDVNNALVDTFVTVLKNRIEEFASERDVGVSSLDADLYVDEENCINIHKITVIIEKYENVDLEELSREISDELGVPVDVTKE